MCSVLLANYLGKGGIVYAFIISIGMEVANLLIMTKAAMKAEELAKKKFKKVSDGFKQREKELHEAAASLKRSNEALETQATEYINTINAYEKQIREKDKLIQDFKAKIETQNKIIAAATKPAWE
jgi:uncharacterized protein YlxW (UPF0749 family)